MRLHERIMEAMEDGERHSLRSLATDLDETTGTVASTLRMLQQAGRPIVATNDPLRGEAWWWRRLDAKPKPKEPKSEPAPKPKALTSRKTPQPTPGSRFYQIWSEVDALPHAVYSVELATRDSKALSDMHRKGMLLRRERRATDKEYPGTTKPPRWLYATTPEQLAVDPPKPKKQTLREGAVRPGPIRKPRKGSIARKIWDAIDASPHAVYAHMLEGPTGLENLPMRTSKVWRHGSLLRRSLRAPGEQHPGTTNPPRWLYATTPEQLAIDPPAPDDQAEDPSPATDVQTPDGVSTPQEEVRSGVDEVLELRKKVEELEAEVQRTKQAGLRSVEFAAERRRAAEAMASRYREALRRLWLVAELQPPESADLTVNDIEQLADSLCARAHLERLVSEHDGHREEHKRDLAAQTEMWRQADEKAKRFRGWLHQIVTATASHDAGSIHPYAFQNSDWEQLVSHISQLRDRAEAWEGYLQAQRTRPLPSQTFRSVMVEAEPRRLDIDDAGDLERIGSALDDLSERLDAFDQVGDASRLVRTLARYRKGAA